MSEYYLGVDAGGSHSRAVVLSGGGEVIGFGRAGAANFRIGSFVDAAEAVQRAVKEALGSAHPAGVRVACIGSAGLEDEGSEAEGRRLLGNTVNPARVVLDTDAYIAWAGALGLKPGAVVVAGTGSICLAVDAAGQRYRRGGWGPAYGDEGSAYAMANAAIREALKVLGGRSKATELLAAFLSFAGLPRTAGAATARDVAVWLYAPERSSAQIASFAKEVDRLADQNCVSAQQLLSAAGADLATLTAGLDTAFPRPVPVSVGGSVLLNNRWVNAAFCAALPTGYAFVEPAVSPVMGAALLALRQDKAISASLLARLADTLTERSGDC